MAKKRKQGNIQLDFSFYSYLLRFYRNNKGAVRRHYRALSKKFLDYNDPENANAFLRTPQFEALEIYIFLKEFQDNRPVHRVFENWYRKKKGFENRKAIGLTGAGEAQLSMFEQFDEKSYEKVFKRMKKQARLYPNYIFALTMGTGKTILMATCIFYEFILANKFPKDKNYCHNALVFAPDKTVLQSLKEIQTFDMGKVVPPEYVNFLSSHIQFHFLEEAGTSLSTLDHSRFNLIISNTQKIILKKQHKEPNPTAKLFGSGKPKFEEKSVYAQAADLYDFDTPEDEKELSTNQRFEKLRRLGQIGIYIDEAHHAFGKNLAKDTGSVKDTRKTSLRNTVDLLAKSLENTGTHVVACYNYTGTPYVGQEVLPEVVYAYGLQEAIDRGYLKKVTLHGYTTTKDQEFISLTIANFLEETDGLRPEGMLPKLALFGATIDEVQQVLRPAVEQELAKHGISSDTILVNVGDSKITTNDDIREFNRLDSTGSEKRFILLVNKGREGWNCRSLFGVGLFREPRSKIFVLQATMRCLRQVGDVQYIGQVYLSHENMNILNDELQQNFRISADEFQGAGKSKKPYKVHVVPPPRKIKLKRINRQFQVEEKELSGTVSLALEEVDTEKYKLLHYTQDGLSVAHAAKQKKAKAEDLSHLREQRVFSELTLVAEISRYLNKSCLAMEDILDNTEEGTGKILEMVNEYNQLLYDELIPRLFHEMYGISTVETTEEYDIELVNEPENGFYEVSGDEDKVARNSDPQAEKVPAEKSFHLDTYCFDSNPERDLFWRLLQDKMVKEVFFTGMLTHGQSDFYVQYIDPESHTVRSYYPDFLVKKDDNTYLIIEVKGEHQLDDPIVKAKQEYAEQLAVASGMSYKIIGGKSVGGASYHDLLK
jgi:type III restriction enzyme